MQVDCVKNPIRIESNSKMEFLEKILSIVGRLENVCAISMLNNKLEMQTFMLPKIHRKDSLNQWLSTSFGPWIILFKPLCCADT